MQITSTSPSFGAYQQPQRNTHRKHANNCGSQNVPRQRYSDSFDRTGNYKVVLRDETAQRPQNHPTSKQTVNKKGAQRALINQAIGLLMGLSIALTGAGISEKIEDHNEKGMLDTYGNEIVEIAEYTEVPEKVLFYVNDQETVMETGKIYIPEEFDGFDVEIEKYKEKLNDEDLNPKKREQYEGILARLEERKDLMESLGEVYIDEKEDMALIILNGIYDAEEVKEALGLKDGVLRKYNNLDYDWTYHENPDIPGAYKDYRNSKVGGLIKVPVSDINI